MNRTILLVPLLFCLFCSVALSAPLKVGVLTFDPPYVYSTTEGFDIELINSICEKLSLQCQLLPMNYHEFFQSLDNETIELAIGAIFINPVSEEHYMFTLPYMVGKGQFLTLRSSSIQSPADLKGQIVGVIKGNPVGNTFANYINQNFPGQFQLKDFESVNDLITDLTNKTIAAAFLRRSSANYWEQNGDGVFKTFGPIVTIGSGMGIMTLPKNTALIQQINGLLEKMEADGSYLTLYNIYFPSE